jgi:hypothetical protein
MKSFYFYVCFAMFLLSMALYGFFMAFIWWPCALVRTCIQCVSEHFAKGCDFYKPEYITKDPYERP